MSGSSKLSGHFLTGSPNSSPSGHFLPSFLPSPGKLSENAGSIFMVVACFVCLGAGAAFLLYYYYKLREQHQHEARVVNLTFGVASAIVVIATVAVLVFHDNRNLDDQQTIEHEPAKPDSTTPTPPVTADEDTGGGESKIQRMKSAFVFFLLQLIFLHVSIIIFVLLMFAISVAHIGWFVVCCILFIKIFFA